MLLTRRRRSCRSAIRVAVGTRFFDDKLIRRLVLTSDLLQDISAHNEPLINIVRVLILVVSLLMAWGALTGRSHYPRWIVAVLPIVLLAAVFASYVIVPSIGGLLLPAAMNIAHVVFFAISTWVAARLLKST